MNRLLQALLQVAFAFIIILLAGVVAVSVQALLHSQSQIIFGITFLIAIALLLLFVEKSFPSVYRGSRRPRTWWQSRRTAVAAVAIVYPILSSILSSGIATFWFGAVIASGVLVALFLHVRSRGGEL